MVQAARGLAGQLAERVLRGDLPPGARVPAVRELARAHGCAPGTAARALTALRRAGVVAGPHRARAVVTPDGPARAAVLLAGDSVLRLAGSDDPVLDAVLRAAGPALSVGGPRGSLHGLRALASGAADAAVVHLRHAGRGRDTDDFAARALGGDPVRVVHLWRRTQGLVVPRGNPRSVRTVADLAGRRVAWRNPGSGTRLLLERLLAQVPAVVRPVEDGALDSHLGVAVAVATGAAEAGLGVASAAVAAGVDWVPVADESFELVVGADELRRVQVLLEAVGSASVQRLVAGLRGYDLARCGEVRVVA
jgi:molybdate-binding protein